MLTCNQYRIQSLQVYYICLYMHRNAAKEAKQARTKPSMEQEFVKSIG